jgi:glycosyltransferase involved in cell wall biosynthesis
MKSPDHPQPSGDRLIARNWVTLLEAMGHDVEIVSNLRSWNRHGFDSDLETEAQRELSRLKDKKWDCWFTYHNYPKAPDLLGPECAKNLSIPYYVIEASLGDKYRDGPWKVGYKKTYAALNAAQKIISHSQKDHHCLMKIKSLKNKCVYVKPFIEVPPLQPYLQQNIPTLLSVGMMRPKKLKSFKLISEILTEMLHLPWQLWIIGDGEERKQVESYFTDFPKQRIKFLGKIDHENIGNYYRQANCLLWPAIDEAIGMTILEAGAHGCPVVAFDSNEVSRIIQHGVSGYIANNIDEYKEYLEKTMKQSTLRRSCYDYVKSNHSLEFSKKQIEANIATPTD